MTTRLGHATVTYETVSSILTRTSGYLADHDFSLNPYAGCTYGCSYCYAAAFARSRDEMERWGDWVRVKENAVDRLRRMRAPLAGRTIYMSSVTDPYQPIERRLGLVRALLEELVERRPRLVVQTRSPLVTRDVDLFRRFERVRVNMTVTTDDEAVRRRFEPHCATLGRRLAAIAEVAAAGVPTCVTLTPLLPVADPDRFADALLATGVERFVVQPFQPRRGRFSAGTPDAAVALLDGYDWSAESYRRTVDVLRRRLPTLAEGRAGFGPA
jgi:DNA repair photolyase